MSPDGNEKDPESRGMWNVIDSRVEAVVRGLRVEMLTENGWLCLRLEGKEVVRADVETVQFVPTSSRRAELRVRSDLIWLEQAGVVSPRQAAEEIDRARQLAAEPLALAAPSAVAVWSYPGRTQADAARDFATHAATLATEGYEVVSQSWGEGRPGIGRVLTLGLAANALRPKGFLTVTYRLRADWRGSVVESDQPADLIETIKRLGELRDANLLTADEFEAKKRELLSRL